MTQTELEKKIFEKEEWFRQKQHHERYRDDLREDGDICKPYEEDYNLRKHIDQIGVGVCECYKGGDQANKHTQRF